LVTTHKTGARGARADEGTKYPLIVAALQPATTRRSNSVGRWPRSGAGAEAENTRSCQGAGRFWNEDRLPPAEPGR